MNFLEQLMHLGKKPQQQALPMAQMAQPMAKMAIPMATAGHGAVFPQQSMSVGTPAYGSPTMYGGDLQETQTVPQVSGQMYGNETNDATGIQGMQNPGFTPVQSQNINYRAAIQAPTFDNVQQDPFARFRKISF